MFKRSILFLLKPLFRNHVYTLRHGLGKGFKLKGGLGFLKPYHKTTPEELFLSGLKFDGKVIYDVGSHVGITTMFFAKTAGKVIAFEPNPANVAAIKQNLALNNFDNVEIIQAGVGATRETKALVYNLDDLATGSMNHRIQAGLMATRYKQIDVEVYPLDHYIEANRLPAPDFVKIDVEGMEYDVLLGMKKIMMAHKPELYIELHGAKASDKSENTQKVFQVLLSCNYSVYHVETGRAITSQNLHEIREGHFSCA